MDSCFIYHATTSTEPCSACGRPVSGSCIKDFPFSARVGMDCASSIRTGIADMRKDEELF